MEINLIQYGQVLIDALEENSEHRTMTTIDGELVLGEKFKKLYTLVCSDKGILTYMDYEFFRSTQEAYKDTVIFKLLKNLEGLRKSYKL